MNHEILKVGICELNDGHFLHTYSIIKLLLNESDKIKISAFISEKNYTNIKIQNPEIFNSVDVHIFSDPQEKIFPACFDMFKITRVSRKLDVLIVNSLIGSNANKFTHLFLRPKCKYILIDSTNGNPFQKTESKELKRQIFNSLIQKNINWHFRNAKKLIFHSREIIKIKASEGINKPMLFLPFTLYEDRKPVSFTSPIAKQSITFTITGGIEEIRKNYSCFFEAINNLIDRNPELKHQFDIIFLGTIKGANNHFGIRILEKVAKLNNELGINIITYKSYFIEENEYRKQIEKTDILINPLNLEKYINGGDSSGVGESIAYAIPGIFPEGYIIYDELQDSTMFYKNGLELSYIMEALILDKKLLKSLKEKAVINGKKFSVEKLSPVFFDFIKY